MQKAAEEGSEKRPKLNLGQRRSGVIFRPRRVRPCAQEAMDAPPKDTTKRTKLSFTVQGADLSGYKSSKGTPSLVLKWKYSADATWTSTAKASPTVTPHWNHSASVKVSSHTLTFQVADEGSATSHKIGQFKIVPREIEKELAAEPSGKILKTFSVDSEWFKSTKGSVTIEFHSTVQQSSTTKSSHPKKKTLVAFFEDWKAPHVISLESISSTNHLLRKPEIFTDFVERKGFDLVVQVLCDDTRHAPRQEVRAGLLKFLQSIVESHNDTTTINSLLTPKNLEALFGLFSTLKTNQTPLRESTGLLILFILDTANKSIKEAEEAAGDSDELHVDERKSLWKVLINALDAQAYEMRHGQRLKSWVDTLRFEKSVTIINTILELLDILLEVPADEESRILTVQELTGT